MNKIIAVDFDGTLCTNAYPLNGEPIRPTIDRLLTEQKNGAKLILWTCRVEEYLQQAIEWCKAQGITFDTINDNLPELQKEFGNNTRKIAATEYWDDRAVNPEGWK